MQRMPLLLASNRTKARPKISKCNIAPHVLSQGTPANTRIKSYNNCRGGREGDVGIHELATAFETNTSLVHLVWKDLSNRGLETLCRSIAAHPSLVTLEVPGRNLHQEFGDFGARFQFSFVSPQERTPHTGSVNLVKVNTILQVIVACNEGHLFTDIDETVYDEQIVPRLHLNSLRPDFQAICTAPREDRTAMLLGKLGELYTANEDDLSVVYLLLSMNQETLVDMALLSNLHTVHGDDDDDDDDDD